ncbi:hypothetical protein DFJ73DRAFT_808582 [Zopfochytrium polystomum]|nr:hypothetical protein DFJ73DRAFT_808582 [Zopfochytrium polystomum]
MHSIHRQHRLATACSALVSTAAILASFRGVHSLPTYDVPSAPLSAPPLPGWTYQGCFLELPTSTEPNGGRALPVSGGNVGGNLECTKVCADLGFPFAGTEFGRECYCGANLSGIAPAKAATACNSPCAQNASEPCGGAGTVTVYQSNPPGPPPFTPTPPAIPCAQYFGCYQDTVNPRTLPFQVDSNATDWGCVASCKAKGYQFAGTENFSECFCSDKPPPTTRVDDATCRMPCEGAIAEACGGAGLLTVYNLTGCAPPTSSLTSSSTPITSPSTTGSSTSTTPSLSSSSSLSITTSSTTGTSSSTLPSSSSSSTPSITSPSTTDSTSSSSPTLSSSSTPSTTPSSTPSSSLSSTPSLSSSSSPSITSSSTTVSSSSTAPSSSSSSTLSVTSSSPTDSSSSPAYSSSSSSSIPSVTSSSTTGTSSSSMPSVSSSPTPSISSSSTAGSSSSTTPSLSSSSTPSISSSSSATGSSSSNTPSSSSSSTPSTSSSSTSGTTPSSTPSSLSSSTSNKSSSTSSSSSSATPSSSTSSSASSSKPSSASTPPTSANTSSSSSSCSTKTSISSSTSTSTSCTSKTSSTGSSSKSTSASTSSTSTAHTSTSSCSTKSSTSTSTSCSTKTSSTTKTTPTTTCTTKTTTTPTPTQSCPIKWKGCAHDGMKTFVHKCKSLKPDFDIVLFFKLYKANKCTTKECFYNTLKSCGLPTLTKPHSDKLCGVFGGHDRDDLLLQLLTDFLWLLEQCPQLLEWFLDLVKIEYGQMSYGFYDWTSEVLNYKDVPFYRDMSWSEKCYAWFMGL